MAPLLLDAPGRGPGQHRCRPARHPHPVAGRLGEPSDSALEEAPAAFAGHSLGQVTALIAAGAVGREEGIALAVARADACRASDDARPGRLAALLGATLEQAPRPARAATERLLGRQRQRTRAGRDRRHPRGPRRRRRGRPRASGCARRCPWPSAVRSTPRCWHRPSSSGARRSSRRRSGPPTAPIVDNTDVEPRTGADGWAALLARHLVEPVRWRDVQLVLRDDLGDHRGRRGGARRDADRDGQAHHPRRRHPHPRRSRGGPADGRRGAARARAASCFAPVTGRFVADGDDAVDPARPGDIVLAGTSVGGVVGSGEVTPVTTPFTGVLAGLLAHDGERVREGQPIAWLRVACERRPRRHRLGRRHAPRASSPTPTSRRCYETSDEWIRSRSGIAERRWADPAARPPRRSRPTRSPTR